MSEVRQADDFFVLARNQTKGFGTRDLGVTGSGKGNARRELERDSKKAVGEGWREWRVVTGQQRNESAWDRVQTSEWSPVKIGWHSSSVVEFLQEIHASVSLHMHNVT